MNNTDLNHIIDRLHMLETAYKGHTTRLKLLEAEVQQIKEAERKRL